MIDHGLTHDATASQPFYVMQRYDGSLRGLMQKGIPSKDVLKSFAQILDGVEAAHLQQVIHRDLKPENILFDAQSESLAIADFGTARFTENLVASEQTAPGQRLGNFQYAAPEQRTPKRPVGIPADIYSLGLILNEMFTGAVPHGTDYRLVGSVEPGLAYLDELVSRMLKQAPEQRPGSIAEIKKELQRYVTEAISLQRLSKIDGMVIKSAEVDEPLAKVPPRLVDADWNRGLLTLILDRPVTAEWIQALHKMGSFSHVLGKPPQAFNFQGNQASITAAEHEVPSVVENFKLWLPAASRTLNQLLEEAARRDEMARREQLRRDREAEEQRLRVLRNLKI